MKRTVISIVILISVLSYKVHAHGVLVDIRMESPVVIVQSSFSATQLLVNAKVTVYSPLDTEIAWQTGGTDKAGKFAFVPDVAGDWVFLVDDGKGHKKRVIVSVKSEFFEVPDVIAGEAENKAGVTGSGLSKISKVIIGLSLMFGVTGIFYGVRSKQSATAEQ